METILLLVEDDVELFLGIIGELHGDFKCHHVSNGRECLAWLKSNRLPHMIFTDINMPLMCGFELSKTLKQDLLFCNIPIVVMSTGMDNVVKDRLRRIGINNMVCKSPYYDQYKNEIILVLQFAGLIPLSPDTFAHNL